MMDENTKLADKETQGIIEKFKRVKDQRKAKVIPQYDKSF